MCCSHIAAQKDVGTQLEASISRQIKESLSSIVNALDHIELEPSCRQKQWDENKQTD